MDTAISFPRYDKYKDSGVEWIGEIPNEWRVESIRAITELKSEKNRPELQVLSVYREYGVIPKNSRNDNHNATSLDTSGYKVVDVGDLVVNKMKAWQGSMGVSEHAGIVSPAYITCHVNSEMVAPRYLHYLLRSKIYIGVYNALSYGVRVGQWDMHYEDFKGIPVPLPDLNTQQRIANFLDQKTAEIDAAIAKKQRLIELLKEQKAILINQAVTQGLDPNVPMRDSGVEWIGKVPEHWEVFKLKSLVQFFSGGTPSKENPSFWNGDIPWISPKDMKKKFLESSIDTISSKAIQRTTIKLLQPNCVLIVVRGMILAKKIPVAINLLESTINQDMKAMVTNHFCLPEFLLYLLDGVHEQLSCLLEESGHGTKTLPSDALGNFYLPIPPITVQEEIIKEIKAIDAQFDETHHSILKHIDHLNEYKQTLISEAVTGKIKL